MTDEKLSEITYTKEKITNLKYMLKQVKEYGVKYTSSFADHYGYSLPEDISNLVIKELERQISELEAKFANY